MGDFFEIGVGKPYKIRAEDSEKLSIGKGGNAMLARERHKLILELLKKDGTVRTADLVETMSVSSETVRKDLDFLEQAGQLERVHGGAVPVPKKLVAEVPLYIHMKKSDIPGTGFPTSRSGLYSGR